MSLSSRVSDGRVEVSSENGPVFTYRFGEGVRKPFLHPVHAPSGAVLTADSPGDHPEHHGIFFGWADVDGIDFWSEPSAAGAALTPSIASRSAHTLASLPWLPSPVPKGAVTVFEDVWINQEGE
jgi:hypothetical protein